MLVNVLLHSIFLTYFLQFVFFDNLIVIGSSFLCMFIGERLFIYYIVLSVKHRNVWTKVRKSVYVHRMYHDHVKDIKQKDVSICSSTIS